MHCRAILFDLDGVLVDSAAVVERVWNRWRERHGLDLPDLVRRAHGRRSMETIREVAPHLDADAEVRWLENAELSDTEGLAALPGAHEALTALAERERAVVTSGGRPLATLRLGHVGLPIPKVLITAEDLREGKPSPEGYLAAAERLRIDPTDCIVVEDTPPGIEAGNAAGARVVAVATTFPVERLRHAERIVPSLAALALKRRDGVITLHASTSP